MGDIKSNVKFEEVLPAGSYANTVAANAAAKAVELSGFTCVSFVVTAGTVGGSLDCEIKYGDAPDTCTNSFDPAKVTAHLTTAGAVQVDIVFDDIKDGMKYVMPVFTLGGTCVVGAIAALGGARYKPVN